MRLIKANMYFFLKSQFVDFLYPCSSGLTEDINLKPLLNRTIRLSNAIHF